LFKTTSKLLQNSIEILFIVQTVGQLLNFEYICRNARFRLDKNSGILMCDEILQKYRLEDAQIMTKISLRLDG